MGNVHGQGDFGYPTSKSLALLLIHQAGRPPFVSLWREPILSDRGPATANDSFCEVYPANRYPLV